MQSINKIVETKKKRFDNSNASVKVRLVQSPFVDHWMILIHYSFEINDIFLEISLF